MDCRRQDSYSRPYVTSALVTAGASGSAFFLARPAHCTRVLINGVPGPPIHHRCGLWQGDPVSPMLFVMVIDTLNNLICRAASEGVLQRLTT